MKGINNRLKTKKTDTIGNVANLDHKSSLTQVKIPIIIPRVYHQQEEHC